MAKSSFFSDDINKNIDTTDFQDLVDTLEQRNADALQTNTLAQERADKALGLVADAMLKVEDAKVYTEGVKTATQANAVAAGSYEVAALAHMNASAGSATQSATSASQAAASAADAADTLNTVADLKMATDTVYENTVAVKGQTEAARDASVAARSAAEAARDTATTKASDAASSAATAADKASQLTARLMEFNEVYIGKRATAPTVDGNGNPLKVGAIYENTTVGKLYQWGNDHAWHPYDEDAQAATNNAILSASNAASSASAANQSKQDSATNAAAALASKTAAATSETNAAASASQALDSKNAAKTSETNSKTSETNAATSASQAAAAAASITDGQVNPDWNATSGKAQILNKPVLAAVATTGNKSDIGLSNVENKTSATIRSELTSANVTTALGYGPTQGATFPTGTIGYGVKALDSRTVANPTTGLGYPGGVRFRFGYINDTDNSTGYADIIDLSTFVDSTGGGVNALYLNKPRQAIQHKWAAAGGTTWTTKTLAYTDSDTTGNAASATKLQTARTINGVSFDGTANVTIADGTKEPSFAAGTTAQYFRGDKTWQALNSATIGLGSVENKSSTTIRSELTSANVTTALGYTPYNSSNPNAYITAASSITGNAATATNATNTYNITNASATNFVWTGTGSFKLNRGASGWVGMPGGIASGGLQVFSDDSGPALMTFIRSGYFAVNLGIDADNVIRMGGWSAGSNLFAWEMNGNFTASGNIIAYSDERLKANWRDVGSDFVKRWANVKHGIYDRTDTNERQVGLSAQAVQAILPDAVCRQADGYLALNYGGASAVATVKLAQKVVELEQKLEALLARLGEV